MQDETVAIVAENLSKKYPGASFFALHKLNLQIKRGEVYGFLGPNGAGKSTTIRLLMNFIQPSAGTASILNKDVVEDSVKIKAKIGYLPGEIKLYGKMTGGDFLTYMAQLQKLKRPTHLKELIRTFKFNPDVRISNLSKGNRQKVGIIQAFMHEPEVLILDEPTSGLDPLMQEAFFELVRSSKNRGATVFVSSHDLSEVQKICDRAGFIRAGKLIAEQQIGELNKSSVQVYDISFYSNAPVGEIKRLKNTKLTQNSPRHISVQIKGELAPLFRVLARHSVHSLDRRESNLEDEFLSFYKDDKK